MQDKVKLVLAILLLAGGVVGFYYFADQSLLYRVLGLLVVAGVALAVGARTQAGMQTVAFGRNAMIEVRKVVWPSRKETTQTTLIVLAMVVLVGLLLWLFDMFLLWAVKLLTGQGG
ncbi:MAG TPA: preprotein translocase subunit SecE [Gammaproteobacteria bacterium]|nr:preprotein translocase subunit SecE [Gammaproteobacteria bacterium]